MSDSPDVGDLPLTPVPLRGKLLLISVSNALLCKGILVISPKAVLKMKSVERVPRTVRAQVLLLW